MQTFRVTAGLSGIFAVSAILLVTQLASGLLAISIS